MNCILYFYCPFWVWTFHEHDRYCSTVCLTWHKNVDCSSHMRSFPEVQLLNACHHRMKALYVLFVNYIYWYTVFDTWIYHHMFVCLLSFLFSLVSIMYRRVSPMEICSWGVDASCLVINLVSRWWPEQRLHSQNIWHLLRETSPLSTGQSFIS